MLGVDGDFSSLVNGIFGGVLACIVVAILMIKIGR